MAAEIAALSEGLVANVARERPLACVLAEVVPQVTAFLESALASCVFAAEIKFDALACVVLDLNCLVPLAWDASECLVRLDSRHFDFFVLYVP